jgi:hypothetical protein
MSKIVVTVEWGSGGGGEVASERSLLWSDFFNHIYQFLLGKKVVRGTMPPPFPATRFLY